MFPEKHRVDKFTTPDIIDFVRLRQAKGYTERGIYGDLSAIRRFFKYLIDEQGMDFMNPVRPPKRPEPTGNEQIFLPLQREEILQILDCVRENYFSYTYFMFWFTTGVSIAEMAELHWRDVDFKNALVKVPESRGKLARDIPICAPLLPRLTRIREDGDAYLCRNWLLKGHIPTTNTLKQKWWKVQKRAGIPNHRSDSIAHGLQTWLLRNQIALPHVYYLLGRKIPLRLVQFQHEPLDLEAVRAAQQLLVERPALADGSSFPPPPVGPSLLPKSRKKSL